MKSHRSAMRMESSQTRFDLGSSTHNRSTHNDTRQNKTTRKKAQRQRTDKQRWNARQYWVDPLDKTELEQDEYPMQFRTPTQTFPKHNEFRKVHLLGKLPSVCKSSFLSAGPFHFGPHEIFCYCSVHDKTPALVDSCGASAKLSTWPCCPAHHDFWKQYCEIYIFTHITRTLSCDMHACTPPTHVFINFIKSGHRQAQQGVLRIIPSPFPWPGFPLDSTSGHWENRYSVIARHFYDDDAFGYPERVKVTCAAYHFLLYHHLDIRSTAQTSHCVGVGVWGCGKGREEAERRRRKKHFSKKRNRNVENSFLNEKRDSANREFWQDSQTNK